MKKTFLFKISEGKKSKLKFDYLIYLNKLQVNQRTDPAAEAIFGHKSAASFPTGPVMADPFISPFGLIMTPALSKIYIKIQTFKVNVISFSSSIWFSLSNNDSLHN